MEQLICLVLLVLLHAEALSMRWIIWSAGPVWKKYI